MPHNSNTLST